MPKNDKRLGLVIGVLSFIIFGVLALYLGKDNNPDLRSYHYYISYAFLNNRLGFDYAPAQIQTFLNPLVDLIFYFFVTWFPVKIVGFLMGGLHGLNFSILFFIAFYSLGSIYQSENIPKVQRNIAISALLISVVGLYGPTGISQIGRTNNDNLVSVFILVAILLIVKNIFLRKVDSLRHLQKEFILAGFIIGVSIGLKLTQMVYAIGFVVALNVFKDSWRLKLKIMLIVGLSIISGLLLSAGHWMYQMWSKFESPLYPFYNKIFNSPYALNSNMIDVQFMPKGIVQTLFYPFFFFSDNHYTRPQETHDIRFAIVYVLFVLLALLWINNRFINKKESNNISRNNLLVKIVLYINFFIVSSIPILISRAILRQRLSMQGLGEYHQIIDIITVVLFIIVGLVINEIIKSIDNGKNSNRQRPLSSSSSLIIRFIFTFYISSYIVWQLTFSVHRYLFPLELLGPFVIVILLTYLIKNRTYLVWHSVILFLIIMIVVERPSRDRLEWGESYFDVQVPNYTQIENSIILMANRDPLSYMIPSFPPGIRFLRIERQFNYASTGIETLLMKEIKDIIKAHDGPIYLLARGRFLLTGEEAINKMGMRVDRNETLAIKSISEPDDILLWKVERDY